jgi:hypothetical protein
LQWIGDVRRAVELILDSAVGADQRGIDLLIG